MRKYVVRIRCSCLGTKTCCGLATLFIKLDCDVEWLGDSELEEPRKEDL